MGQDSGDMRKPHEDRPFRSLTNEELLSELTNEAMQVSKFHETASRDRYNLLWEEFDHRYRRLIIQMVRRQAHSAAFVDVEELVADVFQKLVGALRSFCYDPAHSFPGYLKTVVRSVVNDRYRNAIRRADAPIGGTDAMEFLCQLSDSVANAFESAFFSPEMQALDVIRHSHGRTKDWQLFEMICLNKTPRDLVLQQTQMTNNAVSAACLRIRRKVKVALDEILQLRGGPGPDPPARQDN